MREVPRIAGVRARSAGGTNPGCAAGAALGGSPAATTNGSAKERQKRS